MKNLVGFLVGEVRYAVDILKVREIINPLTIVDLPHAPPAVLGVADHRGEVVPIIDLRQRFALPRATETRRTKWIIVSLEAPGGPSAAGLVVDAVTDVFGAGSDSQRDIPKIGAEDARGITTVYARHDGLTFVLDVDLVAAAAEEIDISRVAAP
ncbi:MAG: chemotaxis protein CheW [Myxococcota bacterium]